MSPPQHSVLSDCLWMGCLSPPYSNNETEDSRHPFLLVCFTPLAACSCLLLDAKFPVVMPV